MNKTPLTEKKIQEIRYCNTLHGFNPFTQNEGHIVGLVYNDRREITFEDRQRYQQEICSKLNIDTSQLFFETSYGGEYLEVMYSSRHRIPEVINMCLEMGLSVKLQNRLQSFYKPGSGPFSLEKSEQLALSWLEDALANGRLKKGKNFLVE